MNIEPSSLAALKAAYDRRELALYLGAGVSIPSGLPGWDQLVLAMYFSSASADWREKWKPFPNYLYAISEWQLNQTREPLDVTARKIRQGYESEEQFLAAIKWTLYAGLRAEWEAEAFLDPIALRNGNPTLAAVADLCAKAQDGLRGIAAVVSYNYDNLLETLLPAATHHFSPVWQARESEDSRCRPIIHVHGYIPATGQGSQPDEIVFTEQQYYRAAHSPYSWSNLAQIQCLSSSVGLMIGLSLSDRNLRRLLDAIKGAPLHKKQFALLKKPSFGSPPAEDLEKIHLKAVNYMEKFITSGAKKSGPSREEQILDIFSVISRQEQESYSKLLEGFGVTPIWYSEHSEIPQLLRSITTP